MYPTIVDFGPFGIHSFGLMLATAFITCVFVIQSELKRRGFIPELASTIVMAAAIGGVVGCEDLFCTSRRPLHFPGTLLNGWIGLVWWFHRWVSQCCLCGYPLSEPIPTHT